MICKDTCRNYRRLLLILSVMIISLLGSSCVYFNTFYNAQNYFKSAQSQALRDTGRPAPRAIQDYDKVIEKCTYILTEYRNSRWADDALFLLSRSMYYKKQNPLQAKERFLDLIRIFPNSKHIPEAHLYIAKIDYQMRDQREAQRRLQELLDNEQYQSLHPEILLLKSSYYLEERDYQRAQNHLQMIIDRYPKSQQFELAFFTLGTAHFENGNYQRSLNIFEILLNSRASRRTKINSRYYIALNHFYLGEYETAQEILERVSRLEYEPAEIPKLNLLKARCLAGLKNYREAESLYLSVLENNRRTAIAAETSYYLAEMYFLDLLNYEKAIEYYNRIQTELRTSPFVERGVARSAVVSQIIQFSRQDRQISTIDLINEQFKLAEYYLYVMNMPDSTLSVYRDIKNQETRLTRKLDTLKTMPIRDPEIEPLPEANSGGAERTELLEDVVKEGELQIRGAREIEKTSAEMNYSLTDEEKIFKMLEEGRDLEEFPDTKPLVEQKPAEMKSAEKEVSDVYTSEQEIEQLKEDLRLYRNEFVPYSLFASAWVWINKKENISRAEEILQELQENYPGNRYTYATESMLQGEEIRFATPFELNKEQEYELAISQVSEDPAETIRLLRSIFDELNSTFSDSTANLSERLDDLRSKTLFSLGHTYYFQLADTLNAKTYFDQVLAIRSNSDYSRFIGNFYQDNHFVVNDSLIIIEEESESTEESTGEEINRQEQVREPIREEVKEEEKFREEIGVQPGSIKIDDKLERKSIQ